MTVGDKTVHLHPDEGVSSTTVCDAAADPKQEKKQNIGDDKQIVQGLQHVAQFELADELLPSQNTISRIMMTLRKDRRPGPLQISPYMTNFGSTSGLCYCIFHF